MALSTMLVAIFSFLFVAVAALPGNWEDYLVHPSHRHDHASGRYVSVCHSGGTLHFVTVEGKRCPRNSVHLATGSYYNEVNETGWGILEIETFPNASPELQGYAAGVAEGELTRLQIHYHFLNVIDDMCKGESGQKYCSTLFEYIKRNFAWLKEQVAAAPKDDLYWRHVNIAIHQLSGMHDAYLRRELRPEARFEVTPILLMQYSGDLLDLDRFFNKTLDPFKDQGTGRCTVVIKVVEDDIYFAHNTMSSLSWMQRHVKVYKFAFDEREVPGHTYSMSGYPGTIVSTDDYTLISSGLLSTETTIFIHNASLYTTDNIKPAGQLSAWLRSYIANALAKTAKDWVLIFARHNSGTYNNQWSVLDYKLFKPGQPLPESDLLYVLEQAPGIVAYKDLTSVLREKTYWASYNLPSFKLIQDITGTSERAKNHSWYQFGESPRARIIRRDHHKIDDLQSLVRLMRYNDFTHEKFALCDCSPQPYTAEGAMAPRADLNDPNSTYELPAMGFRDHACLDVKATNYEMFKKLRFRAWGGPTYDPLPVFKWSTSKLGDSVNHYGMPDVWNFTHIDLEWEFVGDQEYVTDY